VRDAGLVRRPSVFSALRDGDALASPQLERTSMASSGKRKTTMAKLNRERRVLERRLEKKAKKDARKRAAAKDAGLPGDTLAGGDR
jgi:hypothetical protein